MKPTILAAAIAAVSLAPLTASADVSVSSRVDSPNILLINPGDLLNGVISVEYERALNDFFGLAVGASVTTFRGAFVPSNHANVIAVGPELSARFHFIRKAPGGLWLGPSINGVYIASSNGGASARAFGYGLGAAVGYNFTLGDHFVLQLGLGGGFNDYGQGLAWSPRFRLGLGGRF